LDHPTYMRSGIYKFLIKNNASHRLIGVIKNNIIYGGRGDANSEIHDIESLFKLPDEYFLSMINFGKTSLKELREILEKNKGNKDLLGEIITENNSKLGMAGQIKALRFINKTNKDLMERQHQRIIDLCSENAELGGECYKKILEEYEVK